MIVLYKNMMNSLTLTRNPVRFKDEHDHSHRIRESERIRSKYPDRVPIIVERDTRSDIVDIDKNKYLVPRDLTVGQFVYVIRKRIKLSPEKAIFVFVESDDKTNMLPPTAALISNMDESHRSDDGFLYFTYSGENTFG